MNVIKKFLIENDLPQATFAKSIGVSQSMVYQISNGLRPVPEKACVRIEQVTKGAIRRQDLRPGDWQDIWPELREPSHA